MTGYDLIFFCLRKKNHWWFFCGAKNMDLDFFAEAKNMDLDLFAEQKKNLFNREKMIMTKKKQVQNKCKSSLVNQVLQICKKMGGLFHNLLKQMIQKWHNFFHNLLKKKDRGKTDTQKTNANHFLITFFKKLKTWGLQLFLFFF